MRLRAPGGQVQGQRVERFPAAPHEHHVVALPRITAGDRLAETRTGTGLSQREVADLLGIDRTRMVALVDELEAKGWVKRHPNPTTAARTSSPSPAPDAGSYSAAAASWTTASGGSSPRSAAPKPNS